MAETKRWDEVFARERHLYTTEPNTLLVDVAAGLAPGRALDLGMGEGRNARYLASLGWSVTGVELSDEAVRQACEGGGINVVRQPVEEFEMGTQCWDLVVGMYIHGVLLRAAPRVIAALAPGGLLVVEGFHRDVMALGVEGLTGGQLGYQTNALLRHFQPLRILRYEDRVGMADWRRIEAPLVRMLARKP